MDKGEKWRIILNRLECLHGNEIRPPEGKRLHLYFGETEMSPKVERPVYFDEISIHAPDGHFTGDVTHRLWEDLASISLK